jgi:predicted nucleotidyltransferase
VCIRSKYTRLSNPEPPLLVTITRGNNENINLNNIRILGFFYSKHVIRMTTCRINSLLRLLYLISRLSLPMSWCGKKMNRVKIAVFWNVMPYGLVDELQCLGERKISILRLEEEERRNALLRNVDPYLPNDTVSCLRRY